MYDTYGAYYWDDEEEQDYGGHDYFDSDGAYLDADDEEPDCGRCNCFASGGAVCKKCGPEYGWAGYRRKKY